MVYLDVHGFFVPSIFICVRVSLWADTLNAANHQGKVQKIIKRFPRGSLFFLWGKTMLFILRFRQLADPQDDCWPLRPAIS